MIKGQELPLPLLSMLSLRVFLPFGLGYFLSDLFRTVNAVIADELQVELSVEAGELGLLTSAFFLAFACCQVPVGIMLDRYGPRRVEALLLLVAGSGAAIFALAQEIESASLGRILIGVGASACLMAGFKAFALWFDSQRLALLNGYLLAFGALGGVAATAPVEALVQLLSWRAVFGMLALTCIAVSAFLWFGSLERHYDVRPEPLGSQLQGVAGVIRSRWFRAVAPAALFSQAMAMSVLGLWAGPWLRDVARLSGGEVADYLMWTVLAYATGMAAWATLADRLRTRGIVPLHLAACATAVFCLANGLVAAQPQSGYLALWILYAFSGAGCSLFYAGLARHFPGSLVGRVNAALNLAVFTGAFFLQWGMGVVIGTWPAAAGGFHPRGYLVAFAVVAALQAVSLVWLISASRGAQNCCAHRQEDH